MIFFQLFNWLHLFFLKKKFWELQDTVRTGKKCPAIFINFQLFYFLSRIIPVFTSLINNGTFLTGILMVRCKARFSIYCHKSGWSTCNIHVILLHTFCGKGLLYGPVTWEIEINEGTKNRIYDNTMQWKTCHLGLNLLMKEHFILILSIEIDLISLNIIT
jgi:hypothetical protein